MNRVISSFLVILLLAVYSSCDKPERTVLTSEEKELLDSLYTERVPSARRQADSLCNARYQEIFDEIADSIKQVYIQEIKEIVEGEG